MDGHFNEIYAANGCLSIPPERLLLAKVLMALYSIRSERQFCERLQYDLLFRWFLDLNPDDVRSLDVLTEPEPAVAAQGGGLVFRRGRMPGEESRRVSDQHFSVDATLIEAWASLKSFKPKKANRDGKRGDGNGWADFKGREAPQRHASIDDRSRSETGAQGRRSRKPSSPSPAMP